MSVNKKGFTIIELSIATTFLSVLLITITLLTQQSVSIFRKGLTLKNVNSTGRDIIENLTDTITSSPVSAFNSDFCTTYIPNLQNKEACINDTGTLLVSSIRYGRINERVSEGTYEKMSTAVPLSGVFCTGSYSYLWNSGYALNIGGEYSTNTAILSNPSLLKVSVTDLSGATTLYTPRLLRVFDPNRTACASSLKTAKDASGNTLTYYENPCPPDNSTSACSNTNNGDPYQTINIANVSEEPIELLPETETNLVIYHLTTLSPAQSSNSNQALYNISFILGSAVGGVNVLVNSDNCAPPSSYNSNFDYCSVNKFNFSVRSVGSL